MFANNISTSPILLQKEKSENENKKIFVINFSFNLIASWRSFTAM